VRGRATTRKAAAVVVVCLLVLVASGCGSRRADGGSAGIAPPRVIPWLDKRPVEASPHPPLAPACIATHLAAHLFLQGATGSLVGGVNLANLSPRPCSLLGWPRVSFTGAAAHATRWLVVTTARPPTPPDVLQDPIGSLRALRPGKAATVALSWSNWCGPGSQSAGGSGTPPTGLELRLPSGTSLVVSVPGAPRCDVAQAPSTLSVSPFTPATRQLPPSSRLPLRAAIVGSRPVRVKPGLHAFRVRRGSVLHYGVALTNTGRRPFRFRSCPVYREQLAPSVRERAYVLNCGPAGIVAPGATVRFAMELRVPRSAPLGASGLGWELAPKTYLAPFAGASVWVVR
jgi:uncharacterized protein DUF4232